MKDEKKAATAPFHLPPFIFILTTCLLAHTLRAGEPVRVLISRHYRICSDLDEALSQDLAARMDAMYDEYARRLGGTATPAGGLGEAPGLPLRVCLFARQADYLTFTGRRMRNTGGLFVPGHNLVAAFLEGQGRDALRRTLQHEAFHQFADAAIAPDLPVWLNEGMAQLFEEGLWTGETFWLGQVPPRRIRRLQADLESGRLIDVETLVKMTPAEWASRLASDHARGATQYNEAWALVYFLTHARDDSGREPYKAGVIRLLDFLHEGQDGGAAFAAAVTPTPAQLQPPFFAYLKSLRPTPEATMIERQGVLADLLCELASHGQSFRTIAEFRAAAERGRYRLHYCDGELTWDSDADPRTYFCDAAGRPFGPESLSFAPRAGAPLPDVVCRCSPRFQIRTRFHPAESGWEHETLIEVPGRGPWRHADSGE